MALTASAVWECEVSASDSNGGGFDPGVAGMATNLTVTAGTGNTATPECSTATYNFVAGDVGHWLYIKAGTNWIPGWYKISSVASNKATVDAAIGHAVLAAGVPSTVVGVASVATPTSGTWTVDYTQATSAFIAFSDMVEDGTTNTKFTSAAHPAADNLIGNIINVTGGTGFTAQRVAIVSRTTTTYNVDKSLGTLSSTGGTGNLGGAFASPALPYSLIVASNIVWIKAATYSLTSASTNVTGGCPSSFTRIRTEGYGTVRGDRAARPVLQASGISTATLFAPSGIIVNVAVDGASLTAIKGFHLLTCAAYHCSAINCTNNGFDSNSTDSVAVDCTATGCATQAAFAVYSAIDCVAYSNTVTGFSAASTGGSFTRCLSYNNSGASSDGFASAVFNTPYSNCIAYNNGRDGFRGTQAIEMYINCIAEGNAGTGFTVGNSALLISCGVYNNGTNVTPQISINLYINLITGTASFFVNAASGNFALNANAGGGALLRAAGIPGVTPDGLSTGYLDIGAIQSPPLWPPARAFTAGALN